MVKCMADGMRHCCIHCRTLTSPHLEGCLCMTAPCASGLLTRHSVVLRHVSTVHDMQIDLCKENGVIHGQVHGGWYEALLYPLLDPKLSIFQEICAALVDALKHNNKKLYITGHSMGEFNQ